MKTRVVFGSGYFRPRGVRDGNWTRWPEDRATAGRDRMASVAPPLRHGDCGDVATTDDKTQQPGDD